MKTLTLVLLIYASIGCLWPIFAIIFQAVRLKLKISKKKTFVAWFLNTLFWPLAMIAFFHFKDWKEKDEA